MNTTQIQSPLNGPLDLFTGIFYIVRILGLGQGVIKSSEVSSPSGGYFIEQDIFSEESEDDSLWFFKESSNPGFYQWKIKSRPNSLVTYTYYGVDQEESADPSPLLEIANTQDQEVPEDYLWEFESQSLDEYGDSGTGYKIRNKNLDQGVTTFTPDEKSLNGWWLQIEQEDTDNYSKNNRWIADSLFVFEPTNFKLYGESSHLNIEDFNDFSTVHQSKSYLISNQTLQNNLADPMCINITKQDYVDYELYTEVEPGCDILSGLTINSPNTIPSKKYFDFETTGYDGITNLVAKRFVKSTEEFELEPFSRKNISAYVTYLKEFRGIGFYSYTQVIAVADMMGENGEVVKNVPVKDVTLLKHLIRSRGYLGDITEIDGTVGKVQIKVRGFIRGSLPIPQIQFEEGPNVHVPQFEQAYKSRNIQWQHLS